MNHKFWKPLTQVSEEKALKLDGEIQTLEEENKTLRWICTSEA